MVELSDSHAYLKVEIQWIENSLNPEAAHVGIRSLGDMIAEISVWSEISFTPLPAPQPIRQPAENSGAENVVSLLDARAKLEAPLDKFRVLLRCLCRWLRQINQTVFLKIEIPPKQAFDYERKKHKEEKIMVPIILRVETDDPKELAKALFIGESIMPSKEMYSYKIEDYLQTFGEMTPAIETNLKILRQSVYALDEEIENLEKSKVGFGTLEDKYSRFRSQLNIAKNENNLSGDFWKAMLDKASMLNLPANHVEFLRNKHLEKLKAESESDRQQLIDRLNREKIKQANLQANQAKYRNFFEQLMIEFLGFGAKFNQVMLDFHDSISGNPSFNPFSEYFLREIFKYDFKRGQIEEARKFYGVSDQGFDVIEISVSNEFFLLYKHIYYANTMIPL